MFNTNQPTKTQLPSQVASDQPLMLPKKQNYINIKDKDCNKNNIININNNNKKYNQKNKWVVTSS